MEGGREGGAGESVCASDSTRGVQQLLCRQPTNLQHPQPLPPTAIPPLSTLYPPSHNSYKWIEANHPLPRMRKQAENLRYIMEAPKLELSPDERVQIPLLNTQESWVRKDSRKSYKAKPSGGGGGGKQESYWDKVEWDMKLPFIPDKWYYRVLWVALLVGVTVYFNWSAGHHP